MDNGNNLGSALRSLDKNELISVFNSIMERSVDDVDRRDIMERFEEDFPGLHSFVHDMDEAEKQGMFSEDGQSELVEISDAAEEFAPMTYGMLLGFLTLKELSSKIEFQSHFDA